MSKTVMSIPEYINHGYWGGALPAISSRQKQLGAAVNMSCELGDSPAPLRNGSPAQGSLDALSWSDLYTLETISDECLPKLLTLLSCPSKIAVARSFQGSEANTLIGFLDQVGVLCASFLSDLKHCINHRF